jgi:hypothetical protein
LETNYCSERERTTSARERQIGARTRFVDIRRRREGNTGEGRQTNKDLTLGCAQKTHPTPPAS